jgi:hypothetical protein
MRLALTPPSVLFSISYASSMLSLSLLAHYCMASSWVVVIVIALLSLESAYEAVQVTSRMWLSTK